MPSKRSCPACNKPFIKGVRALLNARTGPRMTTVCQPCAARGLLIVPDHSSQLELCTECERNPACLCSACSKQRENSAVQKYARSIQGPR